MSILDPRAESKTFTLDNGTAFTLSVGDILRHADWDKQTEDDRYFNRQLFRVTGFSILPKDGSPAVLLRQIAHPMREYMYTSAMLTTKLDPAKYPAAKQEYMFIMHDVQFESLDEVQTLQDIPNDMIEYIKFQEDPKRSAKFKSYYKK